MSSQKLLSASLLMCTIYFICMSAAHFVGFKVPVLFVYYDVPSNHYQDMIISFCAFTYAVLFFAATRISAVTPYALVVLATTVIGLCTVNLSADLNRLVGESSKMAYWAQTGMIAGLWAWLTTLYFTSSSKAPKPQSVAA